MEQAHTTTTTVEDTVNAMINDANRELFFQFFAFYSRIEYALKDNKYRIKKTGWIKVDWNRYARKHNLLAIKDSDFISAVKYLKEAPPQEEIIKNGKLVWSDRKINEKKFDTKCLLELVRDIRNNLFHGATDIRLDLKRDCELVEKGMIILEHCLKNDRSLLESFCKQIT